MAQYEPVVDLDSIKNEFPDGTRIADYAIINTIVIELKTLKEDPTQKMEGYLYEIMRRPEFPVIHGEIDFRTIINLLTDGKEIIRKFETIAFRQIESIMSNANKQIISTIDHLRMDSQTSGALVIINELADFFEPDVLVDYISKRLGSKSDKGLLRFTHLNHVVLIQDTHKIKQSNQYSTVIPIYEIINDNNLENRISDKADMALSDIIKHYSEFNKSKHKKLDGINESLEIEKIHKKEIKHPLTGQEWIKEQYRESRYMKDLTDEQFIEFGSLIMSGCYATTLKESKLILDHHKK